jgi:hypothetical protein
MFLLVLRQGLIERRIRHLNRWFFGHFQLNFDNMELIGSSFEFQLDWVGYFVGGLCYNHQIHYILEYRNYGVCFHGRLLRVEL